MVPGTDQVEERHNCIFCGQPFNYVVLPQETYKPGDIYSAAGMREASISGLCEYCFDRITLEFEKFGEE